jgi:hypothetical protein
MATFTAKDGRRIMGRQRANRYEPGLGDKDEESESGGKPHDGGHTVERPIERDESEGETHGLPKVSTSDPDNKNGHAEGSPDHNEAMEQAPGGVPWESDLKTHGMAHDIHITHDSTGSHVRAEHKDGYVHESHHLDSARAHDAAKILGGVTPEMEPQETPNTRARDYPVGPKEESRMKRENKGMGIHVSSEEGHIPGMGS